MHMVTCTLCRTHESIVCLHILFRYTRSVAMNKMSPVQSDAHRINHRNFSKHKNRMNSFKGYHRLTHTILSSIERLLHLLSGAVRNYNNDHMKTYNFVL